VSDRHLVQLLSFGWAILSDFLFIKSIISVDKINKDVKNNQITSILII
jgi:hypothetical protein